MATEAEKYQDYKKSNVEIIGVPQFDYYLDKTRLFAREEFCKKMGLEPERRIILYGSGRYIPRDPDIVQMILNSIKDKELIKECQVLIRPHFAHKDDHLKFNDLLKGEKNVVIDLHNQKASGFSDQWDFSQEHLNILINSLYHCDILINTCSTLTLDAAAMNRPVILIMFDGYIKKKFRESVAHWYTSEYFSAILKFHPAIEVHSEQELKNALNTYLENSSHLEKERKKLIEYFCYRVDGKSGERLFNCLNNIVNSLNSEKSKVS